MKVPSRARPFQGPARGSGPEMKAKCPDCDAEPWSKCTRTTAGGRIVLRKTVHEARRQAARDEGLIRRWGR